MGGDEGSPGNDIGVWDLVEETERVRGVVGFGVERDESVVEEPIPATIDNGSCMYNSRVVFRPRRRWWWRLIFHVL